jgi:hypothetical protein
VRLKELIVQREGVRLSGPTASLCPFLRFFHGLSDLAIIFRRDVLTPKRIEEPG